MTVYSDRFTGDELLTDADTLLEGGRHGEAVFEVQAVRLEQSDEFDLVRRIGLEEIHMDKKDFQAYFRAYEKNVRDSLREEGKDGNAFRLRAEGCVKELLSYFDDLQFYVTGKGKQEYEAGKAMVVTSRYHGDAPDPVFSFWKDGLRS
ncbi:hypothetical protein [Kitasatospora sp. NPDC098663]|uniref:hypothetical protein n=1 Tax=Kitasatospora sp. NPDC098663 TaxID=3364096 RepID=UPI00380DA261